MAKPKEDIDLRSCRVALLAGGKSGEREISLASGRGVAKALDEAGISYDFLDPANKDELGALIAGDYDIAFLCLHGKYGEDGCIQGLCEMISLPYTGSGVWSSALAIDKAKAKLFYEKASIPTPASYTLFKHENYSCDDLVKDIGLPCVVKPLTAGSSSGVFIVQNTEELDKAIKSIFLEDDELLVEAYIKGDEYTVAVLGNEQAEALPLIQIIPQNDFYDYQSKYAPGGSVHLCPAPLDEETTSYIQRLAEKAHEVLGCQGLSRSDFILDSNGDVYILETNTIPGMTDTSLCPDAARAAGINFTELCQRIIKLGLEAHRSNG